MVAVTIILLCASDGRSSMNQLPCLICNQYTIMISHVQKTYIQHAVKKNSSYPRNPRKILNRVIAYPL